MVRRCPVMVKVFLIRIIIGSSASQRVTRSQLGLKRRDEVLVHDRKGVAGREGRRGQGRKVAVIALGIQQRVRNPVVAVFDGAAVAPKEFYPSGVAVAVVGIAGFGRFDQTAVLFVEYFGSEGATALRHLIVGDIMISESRSTESRSDED